MKDTSSKILSNHNISGKFWQMRFETGWQGYAPGQFVMFHVPGNKAFLRRPFGIARMKDGVVEICYKVIGPGTTVMSELKVGEKVNVLGPLGNGFQISNVVAKLYLERAPASREVALPNSGRASAATTVKLLVAGGYGVAPLLGLAEKLGDGVHLFYGAKTRSELLYLDDFKKLGVELHIATEDGSAGEKGLVTDLNSIFKPDPKIYRIFACGPKGMLRAIQSLHCGSDCQLSLESHMGCGYGICMGCAVKLKNGEYARVCKEGPVFDANVLANLE